MVYGLCTCRVEIIYGIFNKIVYGLMSVINMEKFYNISKYMILFS